jgi:hypothetical protein
MSYYYDRTAPLLLTDEASFDAVPVAVTPEFGAFIIGMGKILAEMEKVAETAGSPEDTAQMLSELYEQKCHDLVSELSS